MITASLKCLQMLPVEVEELKYSNAGRIVKVLQGFQGPGGSEDESELNEGFLQFCVRSHEALGQSIVQSCEGFVY